MAEMILKATGSKLQIISAIHVTSTQAQYDTCLFEFDEAWDGYGVRTAVFYSNPNNIKAMLLNGENKCYIPWDSFSNSRYLYIGVYGSNGESYLPTQFVEVMYQPGANLDDHLYPPTPGIYDQIAAQYTDAIAQMSGFNERLDTYDESHQSIRTSVDEVAILLTKYSSFVSGDDWSLALQKAIDDAPVNHTIKIPSGEYLLANIIVSKPLRIVGEGTLKKNDQLQNLFTVSFSNPFVTGENDSFILEDITIDGNEQGVIGEPDVLINNVGRVMIKGVRFKNPAKASIELTGNVSDVRIQDCEFFNGMESDFSATESGHTYHIKNLAEANLLVTNCEFFTEISYVSDEKRAPIAVHSVGAKNAIISYNRLINSGHIDMYSKNHKCMVFGNSIKQCHWTPIKIQESRDIRVINNCIENQIETQYSIVIQGYARAATYGSLEREQYYGIVTGNVIEDCYGGIVISGAPLSSGVTARDSSLLEDDLVLKGYHISGNVMRNLLRVGVYLQRVSDINIDANYIRNWGIAAATPAYQASAITLSLLSGITNITKNTLIGGENSTHAIATQLDGVSTILPASVRAAGNKIKGVSNNYPVYIRYVDTLILTDNEIGDDYGTLIYAKNINYAVIKENSGFDVSVSSKFNMADIANLITDAAAKTSRVQYASSYPLSGEYGVGDIVYNTTPAPSGYYGWICTTSGTPGTWKGFGLIQE